MLKILKSIPITVSGQDCLEQLVREENCSSGFDPCAVCCYSGWDDFFETMADCCTVHGCSSRLDCYFRFVSLDSVV